MSIPQPKSLLDTGRGHDPAGRGHDKRSAVRRGSAKSMSALHTRSEGCPEPVRATLAGGRWLRFDPAEMPLGDRVVAAESKFEDLSSSATCDALISEEIDFREVSIKDDKTAHDPHKWLALHATDLIDRLASWSEGLSVREQNLHAREARWEREARRLRMDFQQTQIELDEIAADLDRRTRKLVDQQAKMQRDVQALALTVW